MKLIIIVVLALLCASQSLGQTTCNNPLKSKFSFEGPNTAAVAEGIKNCKSLQGKASCCNADTFNKIQSKTDELLAKLKESVMSRDRAITDIRKNVIPSLMDSLRRLKEAAKKLASQPGGNAAMLTGINEIANISDKTGNMKESFMSYQKTRTSCVVQMVKLQAATWCLACDPDWASKGVNTQGNVTLSTNMCKRLSNICYDYINGGKSLNDFIQVKLMAPLFNTMATAVEKLANGDTSGLVELQTAFTNALTQTTLPSNDAEKPLKIPASCNKDSCSLICNTMFKDGVVDTSILSHGGEVATSLSTLDLFGTTDGAPAAGGSGNIRRVLQSGSGFEPDDDEAGVTVSFQDDPANTNVDSAALVKVGVAAFVGLIALLI